MDVDGEGASVASTSTSHLLDAETLLSAPAHTLTPDLVESSLGSLPGAARLITAANLILSGRVYDQVLLRRIIEVGQEAGEEELLLLEGDVRSRLEGTSKGGNGWEGWPEPDVEAQVNSVVGDDGARRNTTRALVILQQARRRIDTYDAFYPPRRAPAPPTKPAPTPAPEEIDLDDPWADGDDADAPPVLDDPWAEMDDEPAPTPPAAVPRGAIDPTPEPDLAEPPIDPLTFILQPLPLTALFLAAMARTRALRVTCQRHAPELWAYRLAIVEAIPGWVSPADTNLLELLPGMKGETEGPWPHKTVPAEPTILDYLFDTLGITAANPAPTQMMPPKTDMSLSGKELSAWYARRVDTLDTLGLLDAQLAWVQHGAARDVPGLDAIGEDLSLLSRLIYDANLTPEELGQWSLAKWRSTSEDDIVRSYLANSTPGSVVHDIRHLVLPYLYVLDSRAERAGNADPGLVERMLNGAILDLPLHLVLPCFESSKATLPAPQRLIKDDQTVARLALACLYGSDVKDAWPTMSSIFECLPVWDVSGGDADTDREAIETTLESIASFVRPSVASQGSHDARQLFMFFKPLPFSSLSRALDILDVHLESGEILSRYDVRVYLRTLLQSARDHDEQVTLAEKMVRRQGAMDERRWITLWEDMGRLHGGEDQLLRGAFGMIPLTELMRILVHGLLLAGNIPVAKRVIRRLEPEGYMSPEALEEVALTTSKEFYMRAETGNIHTGDMKLAFECLYVAPPTPAIEAEQDFVQATSRLASFRALANLTPAEIRYTPNKLDLVRRVVSTSDDAYRHAGIILELTDKLGFKGDEAARAEVLAMLVDAAVAVEDWDVARAHVDTMAGMAVPDLGEGSGETETAKKVRQVVWRSCFALGRQSEYPDTAGRLALLAQAVAFCPAEEISHVLPLYRSVEAQVAAHPEVLRRKRSRPTVSDTPAETGEQRVLGSRRAAQAARMAYDLGASLNLPNLRNMTGSPALGSSRSDRSGARSSLDSARGGEQRERGAADAAALFDTDDGVREGARRALVKGVGWLLGADDDVVGQ